MTEVAKNHAIHKIVISVASAEFELSSPHPGLSAERRYQ